MYHRYCGCVVVGEKGSFSLGGRRLLVTYTGKSEKSVFTNTALFTVLLIAKWDWCKVLKINEKSAAFHDKLESKGGKTQNMKLCKTINTVMMLAFIKGILTSEEEVLSLLRAVRTLREPWPICYGSRLGSSYLAGGT